MVYENFPSLSLKEVHLRQYDFRSSNGETEGQSFLHEVDRILLCSLRTADCSKPQKAHTRCDGTTPHLPRIFQLPSEANILIGIPTQRVQSGFSCGIRRKTS